MSRRASLPGAAELFRATTPDRPEPDLSPAPHPGVGAVPPAPARDAVVPRATGPATGTDESDGAAGGSVGGGNPGAGSEARLAVADGAESPGEPAQSEPIGSTGSGRAHSSSARPAPLRSSRRIRAVGDRAPSGRERHEEKITVYCSPQELVDLETARLQLRADHGLAVDRGRIVREALAVVLADLEAKGEASILVRRLRQS